MLKEQKELRTQLLHGAHPSIYSTYINNATGSASPKSFTHLNLCRFSLVEATPDLDAMKWVPDPLLGYSSS